MVLRLFLRERQRDRDAGRLKISQQTYTEELGEKFDVKWGGSISLPTTCKVYDFDVDEPTIGRVFRELIGFFCGLPC